MNQNLENVIKISGNNLHLDVVSLLEKENWDVEVSSYYHDDTTDKPREIDIIATHEFPLIPQNSTLRVTEFLNVSLFVECKYFTEEVAFRIRASHPKSRASALISTGINMDEAIATQAFGFHHHYFNDDSIAILYDTPQKNEKNVFDALTQPIKSLIFFKEYKPRLRGLYYPITVYKGIDGIYPITNSHLKNLQDIKPQQSILTELNYSYRSPQSQQLKTQYFCVDLLHFDSLSELLRRIDMEATILAKHLASQQ